MGWMAGAIAVMGAVLTAAAPLAAQSIIELRPAARVAAGAPVVLADVAVLSGVDAEALAGVIVREAWRGGETITVDDVRRAAESRQRVHWGRISLRGSNCILSEAGERRRVVAEPEVRAPVDPTGTVRARVMARIATIAQAPMKDIRLSFAPDDEEILNVPLAGRTVEVTPTGMSDRLPLAVRIFEGERLTSSRTIRVGVEVRREVVIAAASRRRGEVIEEGDVTAGVHWLGLAARPAELEQVVGSSPRMRINSGQVVMADDVTAPTVVNKGDQVTVYCINGTFVVTMRARAMAVGRDGELVLFQAMDSRQTFYARMDGRGRAVINMAE